MTLSSENILAICKLAIFFPFIFAALWNCFRHGFKRGSGWIYLAIFCAIRIVGSGAQLATINDSSSTTPYTIAAVCAVLGLSPLLLATIGLLSRALFVVLPAPLDRLYTVVGFHLLQLACAIGLILCIVGATNANTPAQITSESDVKIGVGIFAAVYAVIFVLTIIAAICQARNHRGESVLVKAVAFALPFLLVRIAYSLAGVFSGNARFNALTGSIGLQVGMSFVEEVIITLLYLVAGFFLSRSRVDGNRENAGQEHFVQRSGRDDFQSSRFGKA